VDVELTERKIEREREEGKKGKEERKTNWI